MRIGLVIFPFVPSHGSILQTFAIYTKLKEMGHSVTIINRVVASIGPVQLIRRTLSNFKRKLLGQYEGPVFYFGHSPRVIMKNLQPFIRTCFGDDIISVTNEDEAKKVAQTGAYDAFVVGSDQVWRPKYVPDVYHYYLAFVPDDLPAQRIAFCPSFGTDEWEYTEEQTLRCKQLLSKFNAVAVREIDGLRLCHDYLGKDAIHLMDPTILLKPCTYLSTVVTACTRYEQAKTACNTINVYYLDETIEKRQIVDSICRKLQLSSQYINNRIQDDNARIIDRIAPSLSTWLEGFSNASFIVTDSYHATLFALYFNKPFITVINERRGASRFYSLMNDLGLHDRFVLTPKGITDSLIHGVIDWRPINQFLDEQRNRSIAFLKDSLGGIV